MFTNSGKFWNWVVQSSADPNTVGLTVKGVVTFIIPYLLTFLPALGVNVSFDLNSLPDIIYSVVVSVFTLVAATMTVFGAIRKLVLTLKGQVVPK